MSQDSNMPVEFSTPTRPRQASLVSPASQKTDANENFLQHVDQQGVITPTVTTIVRQLQSDLNKFLTEHLTALESGASHPEKLEHRYKQLFSFRRSVFYIRYLQIISNIAPYCALTFAQLLLHWLPHAFGEERKRPALLKKKTQPRRKSFNFSSDGSKGSPAPNSLGPEDVQIAPQSNGTEPAWNYWNWCKSNSCYNSQNQDHVFAMEAVALIVIADVLSVTMRHCTKEFDPSTLHSLISTTFNVFYYVTESTPISRLMHTVGNPILDQWSYVLRRLSEKNLEGVVIAVKEHIGTKMKDDIRAVLQGIRFIDINVSDQVQLDHIRELIDTLIKAAAIYSKSNSTTNYIFNILDNIYQQIDFELQTEALLFEQQTTTIFNMAMKETKQATRKASAMKLLCTLLIHYTFSFFEANMDTVSKAVVKALKDNTILTDVIQCCYRLLEDKFNIDKNLDLIHPLGTSQTYLEKFHDFVLVVYSEQDKNTVKFTNLDNAADPQHNFLQMRKNYLGRMQNFVMTLQNELFNSKKGPVVAVAGEHVDHIVSLYANVLVRIARVKLDVVIQNMIPALLQNKAKNLDHYLIGLRAAKFIIGYNVTELCSKADMDNVKSNSGYNKLVSDFIQSHTPIIKTIIQEICEPIAGFSLLRTSPTAFPVVHFKSAEAGEFEVNDEPGDEVQVEEEISDDISQNSGVTLTIPKNDSFISTEEVGVSQNNPLSPLGDEQGHSITLKRYSVYTSVTGISEKNEKSAKKAIEVLNKAKIEKNIALRLYAEAIQCLPMLFDEGFVKTKDWKVFLGSRLVYSDAAIAKSCSQALQRIMFERKEYREEIIQAMIILLENKEFQDVPCFTTILSNITVLLNIWSQSRREEIIQLRNEKSYSDEQVLGIMKSTWEANKRWMDKLESIAFSYLCFDDNHLRKAALNTIEAISDLVDSEEVPYLKGPLASYWQKRKTLHSFLSLNQEEIIQRALYSITIEDALGVQEDAKILQPAYELPEIAQNSDLQVLWHHILVQITKLLILEGYKDVHTLLYDCIKARVMGLQNQVSETTSSITPIQWINSMSVFFALFGVTNPEETEGTVQLQNMHKDLDQFLTTSNIWKHLQSPVEWLKEGVIASSCATHYQSIRIVLHSLFAWCKANNNIKSKVKNFALLHEICRVLRRISEDAYFAKAFSTKTEVLQAEQSFQIFYSMIVTLNENLHEVSMEKLKGLDTLAQYKLSELDITCTIFNLSMGLQEERDVMLETLMSPLLRPENYFWKQEDRIGILQLLNQLSDANNSRDAHTLQSFFSKVKDNEQKEEVKQLISRINNKLEYVAPAAISLILRLAPIPTLFNVEKIASTLQLYEQIESKGHRVLSPILCQHFENLVDFYILKCFSEPSDSVREMYFVSIYEVLAPHCMVPNVPSTAVVRESIDFVRKQYQRQEHAFEREPIDVLIASTVKDYSPKLLHLCLWALQHPLPGIHLKAYEIICALALQNFGRPKTGEFNNLKRKLMDLENMGAAFRTPCENSLTTRTRALSELLSQAFKEYTHDLFNDCTTRFEKIHVPKRQYWSIHLLTPWCANLKLTEDDIPLVRRLLELSCTLMDIGGFPLQLVHFWQKLALSNDNITIIVNFLKLNTIQPLCERVCCEIVNSIYAVLPQQTLDLLVEDLTEDKYQEAFAKKRELEQSNPTGDNDAPITLMIQKRMAIQNFLLSVIADSDDIKPLFDHMTVLLPFLLTHLQYKTPTQNKPQQLLASILMRFVQFSHAAHGESDRLPALYKSNFSSLCTLLQTRPIKINWSNIGTSFKKSFTKKIQTLRNGRYVPVAHNFIGFIEEEITAIDFVTMVVQCIESCIESDLIANIGEYCLKLADVLDDLVLATKYVTIYHAIMKPTNSANILRILRFITKASKAVEGNNAPDSLNFVDIGMKVLKDIVQTLSSTDELINHTNIFWAILALLPSVSHDTLRSAIEILDMFKASKSTSSFFFGRTVTPQLQKEMETYTASWKPAFQGIQPLLVKGLTRKDSELITLQLLVRLAQTNLGELAEIPSQRRALTSIILLLPWMYNEACSKQQAKNSATTLDSSPHLELPKVMQILSVSVKPLSATLAHYMVNLEYFKTYPDAFVDHVMKELAVMYLPQYAQYLADLLYTLLAHGISEYQLTTLKIIKCFLMMPDVGKQLLTVFAPMLRLLLYKISGDSATVQLINEIYQYGIFLAMERGDKPNVTKETKPLGPYLAPLAHPTNSTIALSMEQVVRASNDAAPQAMDTIPTKPLVLIASPLISPIAKAISKRHSVNAEDSLVHSPLPSLVPMAARKSDHPLVVMVSTFGTRYTVSPPASPLHLHKVDTQFQMSAFSSAVTKAFSTTLFLRKYVEKWKKKVENAKVKRNFSSTTADLSSSSLTILPSEVVEKSVAENPTTEPAEVEVIMSDSEDEETQISTAPTLDELLSDDHPLTESFDKFARACPISAAPLLDFISETKHFLAETSATNRAVKCRGVMDRFIQSNPSDTFKLKEQTRNQIIKDYHNGDVMYPSVHLFRDALVEVKQQLQDGQYKLFLQSDIIRNAGKH